MTPEVIKEDILEAKAAITNVGGVPVEHTITDRPSGYSKEEVPTRTPAGQQIVWDISIPHSDGGGSVTLIGHVKQ